MNARNKYDMLYRLTSNIMVLREIYGSSLPYVSNHLNSPAVIKAFKKLENELKNQLDNLRKQCK